MLEEVTVELLERRKNAVAQSGRGDGAKPAAAGDGAKECERPGCLASAGTPYTSRDGVERPGCKGWQPGTSGGWPRARPPRCKCGGMCMTAGRKQRPGKGCKCADGKPCKMSVLLPPPPKTASLRPAACRGVPRAVHGAAQCAAAEELGGGGDHREDGRQVQQEPPVRATCRARPRAKVGRPSPRLVRRPAQGRLAVYEDDAVQLQHPRVALLRPSARLDGRIGRPHRCAICARPVTGRPAARPPAGDATPGHVA